jgi:hypothetical protein
MIESDDSVSGGSFEGGGCPPDDCGKIGETHQPLPREIVFTVIDLACYAFSGDQEGQATLPSC